MAAAVAAHPASGVDSSTAPRLGVVAAFQPAQLAAEGGFYATQDAYLEALAAAMKSENTKRSSPPVTSCRSTAPIWAWAGT